MQKDDLVMVDVFSKKPPMFIEKDNSSDKGYITCEVKVDENEVWEGVVDRISTTGKYVVRLTEKVK